MKRNLFQLFTCVIFLLVSGLLAFGQGTTAPLSGAVLDPTGAVVVGASVVVKNNNTGAEYRVATTNNGTYTVPALGAGAYTLTVGAAGFKKAVIQDVKMDAGVPATANVSLEIGAASESVVVQGGGEVLQTQSANISTTITGRQITELPFTSRDALDLVLLLPGTNTPGRPRTSTVNGLPKGALNITLDGVNVQDNTLKSSDGFFTYIRPRIDAIDEVTLSTATPGAESSAEGAVQIKFVTRSGNNEFHGSIYEYHRNPALNANYWFNNRDLPPDPRTGKAPRDRVLLNQYGFRVGGPIRIPKVFDGRDRAFFFVNYEEYRLPEQVTRQRTIFNPLAQQGVFQYASTKDGSLKQLNLLTDLAAKTNCNPAGPTAAFIPCPSTIDPTIGKLLGDIRTAATSAGGIQQLADPNYQRLTFTNPGGQARYFPTIRLDFNLASKHHLENIYNYQKFNSVVDFLNGVDPAFPGFPNHGSQISNRFSNVTALRSTLTPTIVNEARFGLTGGTVLFFPEVSAAQFANQGGYSLGIGAAGVTGATVTRGPSRRNAPVRQFNDTVSWTLGAHSLNLGFNFSQINFWSSAPVDGVVRAIGFGVDSRDTVFRMFETGNPNLPSDFPSSRIGTIAGIYAALIGRVISVTGALALDDKTNKYALNGDIVRRARQRETGLFAQDSWRMKPNLTLNYGLRAEAQLPFHAANNTFSQTSYAGLFGISGEGNLFKPGTLTGKVTQYNPLPLDNGAYNSSYNNFAPSFGIAWSPNWKSGLLSRVFGSGGQSVIRAGYSIAYDREGMNVFLSVTGSNPGGTLSQARNFDLGNLPLGAMLRDGIPPQTGFPDAPSFPITSNFLLHPANAFLPNLKIGYVQSFTFGFQREINKDTVFEARYVGNRGVKLWRQYNLNEVGIIENGFLNEFKLAQANLLANIKAGKGNTFAYTGAPGTAPLPILFSHFQGLSGSQANDPAKYTSSNFSSLSFYGALAPESPSALGLAGALLRADLRTNAANAGLPRNLFIVNPDVSGAFLVDNGGRTSYDALQLELRRRLSRGLLVQGSYTFARGFTNMYTSSSTVFKQYVSLRDPGLDKALSPFTLRHAFKVNWIYDLPIGRGKAFAGNVGGVLDRIIGGWEFHGTARLQSGSPFTLGNVELVNMTREQLQALVKVRQGVAVDVNGSPVLSNGRQVPTTYFLPQDIISNTIKAFNPGFAAINRQPAFGNPDPNSRYLAPTNRNNQIAAFPGQFGNTNLVLYGPHFTRFDLSAVKKFKITERVNFEFRGEFLNAFNNINFIVGDPANDVTGIGNFGSQAFGQITSAYRDLSTTNDPGGRLIQFVARINF